MQNLYHPGNYNRRSEPGSNGLAIKDGYLYICQHLIGRVVRTKLSDVRQGSFLHENKVEVIASEY